MRKVDSPSGSLPSAPVSRAAMAAWSCNINNVLQAEMLKNKLCAGSKAVKARYGCARLAGGLRRFHTINQVPHIKYGLVRAPRGSAEVLLRP